MPMNLANPHELKVQIAPTRRVPDIMTIWPTEGEDVDLVMDPRYGLKFRPGSVRVLYVFDLLGTTEPDKIQSVVNSFYKALTLDGELYIIETDFDYVTRAAVGGDISPEEFAKDFARKSYFSLQNIARYLKVAGFPQEKQILWTDPSGLKFMRHHYEVIVSGKKTDEQQLA